VTFGPERLGSGTADRPGVGALRSDIAAWDAFVEGTPNGSFMQLSAWAEASAAKGWRAEHVVLDGSSGVVGAQLLVHRMPPGPWSRAYAPRGPVAGELDRQSVTAFTDGLRIAARSMRLSHVVVDPEIERGDPIEGWLAEAGWRAVAPRQINRTRVIDLRLPEDRLWAEMRPTCRASVQKARRSGHAVTEDDGGGLGEFERLYLETAQRAGFQPVPLAPVYAAFARRGGARLVFCRAPQGQAVAGLMLLHCGDRVTELYGGSTAAGSAARANYLVKWESIRGSRDRGMASYDMWGTILPSVATFKAGFGGVEREYVGAWELVTHRPAYLAFQTAQWARAALSRRRALSADGAGTDGPQRSVAEAASPA
jgi:lipid II:glycine glycyltransferase (peptidoglycan interpeptide bridge formation enzyme)